MLGDFPVFEPTESSLVQKFIPVIQVLQVDKSSIEFEFETDRGIYIDMRDIHLQIKVGLQKGRFFVDLMKKTSMEKQICEFISQMMF